MKKISNLLLILLSLTFLSCEINDEEILETPLTSAELLFLQEKQIKECMASPDVSNLINELNKTKNAYSQTKGIIYDYTRVSTTGSESPITANGSVQYITFIGDDTDWKILFLVSETLSGTTTKRYFIYTKADNDYHITQDIRSLCLNDPGAIGALTLNSTLNKNSIVYNYSVKPSLADKYKITTWVDLPYFVKLFSTHETKANVTTDSSLTIETAVVTKPSCTQLKADLYNDGICDYNDGGYALELLGGSSCTEANSNTFITAVIAAADPTSDFCN